MLIGICHLADVLNYGIFMLPNGSVIWKKATNLQIVRQLHVCVNVRENVNLSRVQIASNF